MFLSFRGIGSVSGALLLIPKSGKYRGTVCITVCLYFCFAVIPMDCWFASCCDVAKLQHFFHRIPKVLRGLPGIHGASLMGCLY